MEELKTEDAAPEETGTEENKKRKNWPLIILIFCVSVALAIVSGLKIAIELISRHQANSYYEAVHVDFEEKSSGAGNNRELFNEINDKFEGIRAAAVDEGSEYDNRFLRPTSFTSVAWLRCEDTKIDYPVMQAYNNEYYLSRLPDGKENKNGSLFLDFRNSPDFTDKNSVIYGHHMKSGEMFTTLKYFNSQSYYDEHPTMQLYTPDTDYTVVLFGGYIIDALSESIPMYFLEPNDFENYVAEVKKRSVFKSNVEVSADDRIVSLVTCSYEFDDARMLIAGILVEN